jgi:hypothetical protein
MADALSPGKRVTGPSSLIDIFLSCRAATAIAASAARVNATAVTMAFDESRARRAKT